MHDVIIAGAGPAGCAAAKTLADKGLSVLLIERFEMPRIKSCSGILIEKSVKYVKDIFGIDVPECVKCEPVVSSGTVLFTDDGTEYRFEQKGVNVWRKKFDHMLFKIGKESGAETIDGTSVINCVDLGDCVEITYSGKSSGKARAAYFIDCEGVTGTVRRKITDEPCEFVYTYQVFYKGTVDLDKRYFYAFLQPELSEYDAWFNVKDDMLVLGVAVKNRALSVEYFGKFLEYMKLSYNLVLEEKVMEEKWIMPEITGDYDVCLGKGRILFAGETAGFLNPMGEGISAAIESGFCAAKAIHENYNDVSKVFDSYTEKTARLKEYMLRQWHLLSKLSGKFCNMR